MAVALLYSDAEAPPSDRVAQKEPEAPLPGKANQKTREVVLAVTATLAGNNCSC